MSVLCAFIPCLCCSACRSRSSRPWDGLIWDQETEKAAKAQQRAVEQ
jgi:hypothetical protein